MFPPIVGKNSSACFILSFADVIKVSFISMTVQDVPYSTMQDAHCPDACVDPHGRVYAYCLFTQQHLKPTELKRIVVE